MLVIIVPYLIMLHHAEDLIYVELAWTVSTIKFIQMVPTILSLISCDTFCLSLKEHYNKQ